MFITARPLPFWAILALALQSAGQGLMPTVEATAETLPIDYLPFILMLFALNATAGGIVVSDFIARRRGLIRCCSRWVQSSQGSSARPAPR